MEIWQLKTFSMVAKNLHFTRAAVELKLTQSAVSHQIKSLEDELGVKLFFRDKGKVSLTPQGNRVLDFVNKILHQVDLMKQEIEDNKDSLQGILKLVAVPRSLNVPYSQIKRDFQSVYPGVELFFEAVISSEAVFENVRNGVSDIGFTTRNENFGDVLPIPYGKFEMLFVVGKDHRLANRKEVSLNELKEEDWVLFENESWLRRKTDEIFSHHKFTPKNMSESNDGAIIRSLIKDNGGVGFLPEWGIVDGLEEGKLVQIKLRGIKSEMPLNIIISPQTRSKLVSIFVNYLLEKKIEGIELYKK
jgi:DNA-binding transcriptional LysR family regulator